MPGDGGRQKEALRYAFDRSIMIDFRGAKINSDTGFLLLKEMDERFGIIGLCSAKTSSPGPAARGNRGGEAIGSKQKSSQRDWPYSH